MSTSDPEAQMDSQVDDTAEKERGDLGGNNTKAQTSAENYGDPSGKLWSMYLTEAKKEDDQKTQNWTEDTGGVLVFTGLFSAIVAAFIMESYKKLSPDSGEQTVALLTQLVNISAGAPAVLQNSPPFKAPASIVRVNIMWFLSLILSLSCALLATLMQQWARRYLEYAQHRAAPRSHARIRAYMYEGIEKFRLSQAVEAMPLLIHTSVFLFFVGLIDFLFPINKAVAFSALGCVVVFAFIYAILTLLPSFRLNCPYRTPLSGLTYISLQLSALNFFSIVKAIEGMFHELLMKIRDWSHPDVQGSQDDWPTRWTSMLEYKVSTHYERFWYGLRWRVERSAMEAPPRVDANALRWTLTTLDEDNKFEDFAARMPGFFDPRAGPDATSIMLSLLMPEQSTPDPILGSRLRSLLETCLPGASPLTEEQRKNRLRVCLKSLWYCVRAYNLPENAGVPLAPYVRAIFASPEVIRWIRTEQDLATRLLGRCFGSLVVKKLANDITSPTRTSFTTITAEMGCLSYILGATGDQVRDWLGQDGPIDLANVISLASGELEALVTSGTKGVPTDVMDVFQLTLSILTEGIVSSHANVEWDTDQVTRFHKIYSQFANARVPNLLKERLRDISDRLPPSSHVEEAIIEMPQNLREVQMRNGGAPDSGFVDGTVNSSIPTGD
ncbi:hypothetical protein BJY52DRAFT_68962 [Lactarius psammicola]|nr:hypothetical protein BJY52DRAFT_68962 [Lactarius psammicola]